MHRATDILDRIDLSPAAFYSPGLVRKLNAITPKTFGYVVRKLTADEAAELGGRDDWFMYNKRQCVIARRVCGQWVVWAL